MPTPPVSAEPGVHLPHRDGNSPDASAAASQTSGVGCSQASHDALTLSALVNVRPWPELGLMIGECSGCMSSLCREVVS
jgi:hypothetical protein